MECSQQTASISFSHWIVNPYTAIISNIPSSDYTLRSTTITSFDTGNNSGRGSSPYIISEITPNTSFCLSCNVRIVSPLTSSSKIFSGICLLDEKYNKIFELSIGAWNTNVLDTYPLQLKTTTLSNNKDITLKISYNNTPSSFTYIDENSSPITTNLPSIIYHNSEQEVTVPSQKIPKYIAIFMRGQGVYESRITNIKYNNIISLTSPIPTPNNNFIRIDNATLNSKTLSRKNTSDVDECNALCASDENCSAFEFNTQNECKLKDFSPSVSTFGSISNSSLYLKNNNKIDLLSDNTNVHFSFTPKLSNLIVNRIHIKKLIINSFEKPEFLIITDDNKTISAMYTYCVIRSTNSPSPISTSTGKLGLKFNIQLSASTSDVKSFYIVTDNLNFDNVTFFNDKQVNVMNLPENSSVIFNKDNISNQNYNSTWNHCEIINQIFMIKPFQGKYFFSMATGLEYFVEFLPDSKIRTNVNTSSQSQIVSYYIDSSGQIQAPNLTITINPDGNTVTISGVTYYVDNHVGVKNIHSFEIKSNQVVFNQTYPKNIKTFGYKIVVYEDDNTPSASFMSINNDTIILISTDNRYFFTNNDQKNLIYVRNTNVPSFLTSKRSDLNTVNPYLDLDKDVMKALKSISNNTDKGNTIDIEWLINGKFSDVSKNTLFFKTVDTVIINDFFTVKYFNYNGYLIFSDIYGTINIITTTTNERNKHLYRFIFPKFQFITASTGYAPYGPYVNDSLLLDENRDYSFLNYRLRMNMKKRQVTINNKFKYNLNFVGLYSDTVIFKLISMANEVNFVYFKTLNKFELDYNSMLTFLWTYNNSLGVDVLPHYNIENARFTNDEQRCIDKCDIIDACKSYSFNTQTNVCQLKLDTNSAKAIPLSARFCFASASSSNDQSCPSQSTLSNTRLMGKDYGTYVPPNNKFVFV